MSFSPEQIIAFSERKITRVFLKNVSISDSLNDYILPADSKKSTSISCRDAYKIRRFLHDFT